MELQNLISACIKKNRAAEKQLYLHYAPCLYGICRRYSQNDVQAEDYLQEGFLKIFSNLVSYDSSKGNFKSWMTKIVINRIFSLKRKDKIVCIFDDHNSLVNLTEESDAVLIYDIEPEVLLNAIRELPEKYSSVLNLYVFENLSHDEISELIGIKASSVRSRFTRAKKLLKNILSENKSIAS